MVFDPYDALAGTAKTCVELCRSCISLEPEPKYAVSARKRLEVFVHFRSQAGTAAVEPEREEIDKETKAVDDALELVSWHVGIPPKVPVSMRALTHLYI